MLVKDMAGLGAVGSWRLHGWQGERFPVQVHAASGNGATPAGSDREFDYDLFTIGAGSGGVRASRFAASTYGGCLNCTTLPGTLSPARGLETYFVGRPGC